MKIKLDSNYKSLKPFQSEELPSFTVIIGKNGSGKSQLVQLFSLLSKSITKQSKSKTQLSTIPEISRCYSETFIIEQISSGNPTEYRNQHISLYTKYSEYMDVDSIKKAWLNLHYNKTTFEVLENFKIIDIEDVFKLKDLLSFENSRFVDSDIEYLDKRPKGVASINPSILLFYSKFLEELKNSLNTLGATIEVANYQNKGLFVLEENDFLNSNISERYIERRDLIESKIEDIFYNYLRKRQKNEFDYFKKEKYSDENLSTSREDFNLKYINPIKEINDIIESLNLPYCFKEITEKDFSPESNIHFDFIKKTNGIKISFNDLSSGEKIILGLIIRLFNSEFYKSDLKFPDVIILDEPDAHLHPEMSDILLKVLNDTFVNKIGIKVIITTHSPSTVALSPEESIFQLNNDPETFLKKISKDDALKILTSGVPNLSIDYVNHRQVFVESPTDLEYYQTLFNKFTIDKKTQYKLYFISNGYGKSNCDQVIKIVNDLRKSGNKTSFGIIDWDTKNIDDKNVYVHGSKKRYSIENFIFDPLYLSILLIEKNFGDLIKDIGYSESDNQYEIIKTPMAQKAIDFIMNKLKSRNVNKPFFSDTLQNHSYGNYSFNIPTWYTAIQGHDLKEQILDQFQPLEGIKKRGEYEVEMTLIKIIGKMYPHVPKETIELYEKLVS